MGLQALEEFLGGGVLRGLGRKLAVKGWDDVAKLKMITFEQMDEMKLTEHQKNALEIRSYLHGRSLMEYADRLESSAKSLTELMNLSTQVLISQYDMKRGHIIRFTDRANSMRSMSSVSKSSGGESRKMRHLKSSLRASSKYEISTEQSMADLAINEDYIFKGIIAAESSEQRGFGCLQPPLVGVANGVAPYSSIKNVSVQKLTPEYISGMDRFLKLRPKSIKASELWHNKPAILVCIRRPGCIMCRAEARQIYARKEIFDKMGFQLIAVLHEYLESEVKDFWPRYWGGMVIFDQSMSFFKALGGGKVLKENFLTGFLFNPRAIANFRRAKATGIDHNFKGEGETKGGLFIVGRGKTGIAYQFTEKNFGDWAPIVEVMYICNRLQNAEAMGSHQ